MTALPTALHELPMHEKLDLLDLLWADIKNSPTGYEPPAWHADVLNERLEDFRSGKTRPLNFDQLVREWRKTRGE